MISNILDNANCKIKTTCKNLHRWKSWSPKTPFAPVFDLPLWIEDIQSFPSEELIEYIDNQNIDDYQKIWQTINIFNWQTNSIKILKNNIIKSYKMYMNSLNLTSENYLYIRGWAVRLNCNMGVPLHAHSHHENTYLSGNLMLSSNKTTTDYSIPHLSTYYGYYKVENKPGRMTLFPSWVEHKVDPIEDEERYSVAFDVFTEHSYQYALKTGTKSITNSIKIEITE
jgi:hypothetical protein